MFWNCILYAIYTLLSLKAIYTLLSLKAIYTLLSLKAIYTLLSLNAIYTLLSLKASSWQQFLIHIVLFDLSLVIFYITIKHLWLIF